MTFEQFSKLLCLKAPYGIWNCSLCLCDQMLALKVWKLPMGFETDAVALKVSKRFGLKAPYGIWNFCVPCNCTICVSLKAPYGIWNAFTTNSCPCTTPAFESSLWDLKPHSIKLASFFLSLFESSLWDLKQCIKRLFWVDEGVWKLPMGFETRHPKQHNNPLRVWKLPMGFETPKSLIISSW